MNEKIITFPVGGRIKPGSWRPFQKPENWAETRRYITKHLRKRCTARMIPLHIVEECVERVDLCRPTSGSALKLGFSRRAIRKANHDGIHPKHVRMIERMVIVVAVDGPIITTWLEEKARRPVHPPKPLQDAA